MPTALIADDEPLLAADLATRLARLWPELDIVATCHDGIAAVAMANRLQPDIAFLDINMPGLGGLAVARAIPCRTVFVTAYDQYALEAFDADARDYLLKPVNDERLAACIARLQREPAARTDAPAAPRPDKPVPLNWITAGLADTRRLIAVAEVCYFKSSDKYTEVVTQHERHLIRTSLKELEERLDMTQFARIHRSLIVRLSAIDRIEQDFLGRESVRLKERDEALPLSRRFAGRFRQM